MTDFSCKVKCDPSDKRTSAQWKEIYCPHQIILDPDGWDRENFDFSFFEELITNEEFFERMYRSTTMINANIYHETNH